MELDGMMGWVERLGGWAVVLIIVRWFMMRLDIMIQQLTTAVSAFQRFESEEVVTHRAILNGLGNIRDSVNQLSGKIKT
jgi:hypothetical protein